MEGNLDICYVHKGSVYILSSDPMSEYNEFKSRLKSPKNRFQLSTGLNLEKFNTILSGTNQPYLSPGLNGGSLKLRLLSCVLYIPLIQTGSLADVWDLSSPARDSDRGTDSISRQV